MKGIKKPGILLREDSCYVGTEDIEIKDTQKSIFFEAVLFLLIGTGFLIFFLSHIYSIKRHFKAGKLDSAWGAFIILLLSPFAAHLLAKILGFLWEKLRLK